MKFQALGSNYSGIVALEYMFTIGSSSHSHELTRKLENRYGGHAYLYAKGRYALAEAVRMVRETNHDNVAINALTCSVVVDAVTSQKCSPLYLDVAEDTAHYDAVELDKALDSNEHVAAVVVQNTFGRMCDIAAIEQVARNHGVFLIEDLAHCMGQTYPDGREAGTVGDLVMLSFGRDKLIDVVNGGALIVRNPSLHVAIHPPKHSPPLLSQIRDRIYPVLTWLVRNTYDIVLGKAIHAGMYKMKLATLSSDGGIHRDTRLPHWQARLVLSHLKQLPEANDQRRQHMKHYDESIDRSLISQGALIRAALTVKDRTAVLETLRENGYELVDTWYDTPVGPAHKFANIDYPSADCPHAVELSKHLINLPVHRHINERDVQKIAEIVEQA